ncbi:MAG: hydroxyacid dehydrogenase, partial [Candidatus Competibacteraceae bacterium]|nr:hydroxyacid dehydrogenase [Candidatus Competibacteraceae bacterium]
MSRVLLTHSPAARQLYYGDKALTQLQQLADVRLHHAPEPLDTAALIEASQGCTIIVSDRATAGTAELFEHAEDLVAFVRCAVDIRTIDVAAASANGVLVTRASPGFITSVAELALGMMVDLARGLTTAALSYRSGATPAATMGRQLAGSTLGIIGYGAIGSHLAGLGKALGMHVLVHDP